MVYDMMICARMLIWIYDMILELLSFDDLI